MPVIQLYIQLKTNTVLKIFPAINRNVFVLNPKLTRKIPFIKIPLKLLLIDVLYLKHTFFLKPEAPVS